MRTAAEGGAIGIAGVLVFMGAILAGLLGGIRRATPAARTVVAAALASGVCFVVHAQLDWIEEFPVIAGPAIGFLLIAMIVRRAGDAPPETASAALGRARIAAAAAVALAAAVAIALPYAALRYGERATEIWRADPAAAYRDLDRAWSLDPFSATPKLNEGTIAIQRAELPRARAAFEAALDRENGWLAHFELALVLAAQGDRGAGMRQLDAAQALNPKEAAIPAARKAIGSGEVVDPVQLNRRLFESPLFNARRLT
jgi:hypothetical protein